MSITTPRTAGMVQFLDHDGRRVQSAENEPFSRWFDEITPELVQRFYREMWVTRQLDTAASALQRQGQLALWVPSIGQEGCQAGAAFALRKQDWVFPAYREHLMATVRGVPFIDIIALLRGNTHGAWEWESTRFHQYTLVIGAQALHGTGFAMGRAFEGRTASGDPETDEAVLTCFGDGATSEGAVSEAMIFAANYQAPVVFFCQNNGWAISVPSATQARVPLVDRARGFGLSGVRIDGNDPLAAYAVSRSLLDHARAGGGPGFIEAVTYRVGPHTSSDDPTKYRIDAEVEHWRTRDPILRVEALLRAEGTPEEFFTEVAEQAEDEAAALRQAIHQLPVPEIDSMFAHVYTDPHPVMLAESAWLREYEASMTEEGV